MRAFLKRCVTWLRVPPPDAKPSEDPQASVDVGLPPGIYLFDPGTVVTGHESPEFYAAARVGEAPRPILGFAYRP